MLEIRRLVWTRVPTVAITTSSCRISDLLPPASDGELCCDDTDESWALLR